MLAANLRLVRHGHDDLCRAAARPLHGDEQMVFAAVVPAQQNREWASLLLSGKRRLRSKNERGDAPHAQLPPEGKRMSFPDQIGPAQNLGCPSVEPQRARFHVPLDEADGRQMRRGA